MIFTFEEIVILIYAHYLCALLTALIPSSSVADLNCNCFKAHAYDANQNIDSMIDYILQYKDQPNKLARVIKQENLNFKYSNFRQLENSEIVAFF